MLIIDMIRYHVLSRLNINLLYTNFSFIFKKTESSELHSTPTLKPSATPINIDVTKFLLREGLKDENVAKVSTQGKVPLMTSAINS